MQDRLNFRFWDTKERIMLDWDCICQTAFNCTRDEGNEIQRYGLMYFVFTTLQRFIPLQCTGLRDKNGKVVYFGDLVKNKWGQICKVIMQTDKQNYGRVILQNVKYLNDEAHKNNIFIPAAINESEVIGNIYENPELLEEKC